MERRKATVRRSPGWRCSRRKPAQLADRAGDRRLLVADVELDDLVARDGAGVRDVDPDRHGVAGRVEDRPVHAQRVEREGRVRAAEPERPERRDRGVDVVPLGVGVAPGGVVAVRQRELADVARHGDRQLAAGVHRPGEDVGDGVRSGVAGDPGEQDRGAVLGRPRQRQRAAADDDEHDRRAGRDHGLEQLLLPAQEPEPDAIAELAGRRVVGEPDRSPSTTTATSASRASATAAASSSSVPDEMPVPRAWTTSAPCQRGAQGVDDRPSPGQLVADLEAACSPTSPSPMTPSASTPERISRSVSMWTRWL